MDYNTWLNKLDKDSKLYKELINMSQDDIKEAFNGSLEFGTGGIRSIMSPGPNRLNIYTIRRISYGFGKYLIKKYGNDIKRGVVVSHDNRMNSREFAIEACKTLGALGIKTFMFETLMPTPFLSYSVRFNNSIAGIMITASHNTKEYNGYKVYDERGCQYLDEDAKEVVSLIKDAPDEFDINVESIESLTEKGLYSILKEEVINSFIEADSKVLINSDIKRNIKVVYTPLHGTGSTLMPTLFKKNNFDASYVSEQMINDSSFTTVKSPNPENASAFTLALDKAKEVGADLIIATDPDADRVGIGVLHNNEYVLLTGNETGSLLIYYYLSSLKRLNKLPNEGMIFNTIVTSPLGAIIANSFNVGCFSTLTGFKYIGEQAYHLEGTNKKYLFGYEESYGYLILDHVRDKDSLQSSLLIAEMANYYKEVEGKDLVTKLDDIHKEYGFFKEYTQNIEFKGLDGKNKMNKITSFFREAKISDFCGYKIIKKEDYLTSISYDLKTNTETKLTLPKSNVIKYILDNNMWIVVRPSGTEPKLKIYYSVNTDSDEHSLSLINKLKDQIDSLIN